MKAILEFNLENPDEALEHEMAVHAAKLVSAIWDFDNKLRSIYKYEEADKQNLAVEKVREMLNEQLSERGIAHLIWS